MSTEENSKLSIKKFQKIISKDMIVIIAFEDIQHFKNLKGVKKLEILNISKIKQFIIFKSLNIS